VIPKRVAIGLGSSGNWPGQRQDPWNYIEASSPHRKFNQVLRPESQISVLLADHFCAVLVTAREHVARSVAKRICCLCRGIKKWGKHGLCLLTHFVPALHSNCGFLLNWASILKGYTNGYPSLFCQTRVTFLEDSGTGTAAYQYHVLECYVSLSSLHKSLVSEQLALAYRASMLHSRSSCISLDSFPFYRFDVRLCQQATILSINQSINVARPLAIT
jgi:hypothetical protein